MYTLEDYIEHQQLSPFHAEVLRKAVGEKLNIVIAGGTGSGKTTFVNALLHEKVESGHPSQRIVILEDTIELQCDAPNQVQLRTCDAADLARLVRATMRLRPDAIVVGEVRGREALDMLKAWNTGHPGGLTTVHANGARAALSRLDQLVQEAGVPSQPHRHAAGAARRPPGAARLSRARSARDADSPGAPAMSRSLDRLYQLLPAVYRERDADQGQPLRALLRVINEQVNLVEDDIAQLYENWFIETCEDWVVPYLGDLIGYRPASGAGAVLAPRRDVANALGNRRRRGTLPLLEELARDVSGWPARAVEFYTLLAWTQHVRHVRPSRARTADLRDGTALRLVGGPFDRLAHSIDVRRISSLRSPGRHNIPSVGLFVWRLGSYPVTEAPARCLESIGPQWFSFSTLGNDAPLFARPEREPEPTQIAEEIQLPIAIRRGALEKRVQARPLETEASAAYYGVGKSLVVYAPDWPAKGAPQPVPADHVVPADLSNWRYRARRGRLGVDPELGRIVFPSGQRPGNGVWVSYRYGFSAAMGGGEYERKLTQPIAHTLYRVRRRKPWEAFPPAGVEPFYPTIPAAIAKWRADQQGLPPAPVEPEDEAEKAKWRVEMDRWCAERERLRAAIVEIADSEEYGDPLSIALEAEEYLQIRAAQGVRPVIQLLDYVANRPDSFAVSGQRASRFQLDGLVVAGRGLRINGPDRSDPEAVALGDLCDVRIRHCTLVPGWTLDCDCEPRRPSEPSLELAATSARVVIEASIVGSIEVVADEVQTDPIEVAIHDSIVDATGAERSAIGSADLPLGFAHLQIARSTVIGTTNVHAIALAENAIFLGPVRVGRRQVGCMRFCYAPQGSRTPRRYHCQPSTTGHAAAVQPRFTSLRYGSPGYCQLALDCAPEIARGADDESEMGAFHDLFQPQRTANLRARIDEYTPAGMDAGILFAN